MIKDLILRNRSYRRFDASVKITEEQMLNWLDSARLSGSAANLQRLRYLYTVGTGKCKQLFPLIKWAGYLPEWKGPKVSERPTAYIIITGPATTNGMLNMDVGLAVQNILLSAVEDGFGGCMIGAFDRQRIHDVVSFSKGLEPLLILALGKPVETVHIEDALNEQDVKYCRTIDKNHHVPKLSLQMIAKKL